MADAAQLPVLAQMANHHRDYIVDGIPIGILGQVYVVLLDSPQMRTLLGGPAILEASLLPCATLFPTFCPEHSLGVSHGCDAFPRLSIQGVR